MAKFEFNPPTDFLKQLGKMSDIDNYADKMLNEAAPILENSLKKELESHKVSGDLYNSIKPSKAKKNKYGWYVAITPRGTDKKGVRNAEKLIYLEYGTEKQEATPVFTKAIKDSEIKVLNKMQEVFERETK